MAATTHYLPCDVIEKIGLFLDYPSRLNAFESSKLFQCINYGYSRQVINLSRHPNFCTHLPYIKRLKPNCCHLSIQHGNVENAIPSDVLKSMDSMSDYINTNFRVVGLTMKQAPMETLESVLIAVQKWRINLLEIDLNEKEIVPQKLLDLLANLKAGHFQLLIHGIHLDILNTADAIGRVNKLIVYNSTHGIRTINFEHAKNVEYIELMTNRENEVTCPEYITTLSLFEYSHRPGSVLGSALINSEMAVACGSVNSYARRKGRSKTPVPIPTKPVITPMILVPRIN
jgi:hypothetical protein